jgi:hypothetical protein
MNSFKLTCFDAHLGSTLHRAHRHSLAPPTRAPLALRWRSAGAPLALRWRSAGAPLALRLVALDAALTSSTSLPHEATPKALQHERALKQAGHQGLTLVHFSAQRKHFVWTTDVQFSA